MCRVKQCFSNLSNVMTVFKRKNNYCGLNSYLTLLKYVKTQNLTRPLYNSCASVNPKTGYTSHTNKTTLAMIILTQIWYWLLCRKFFDFNIPMLPEPKCIVHVLFFHQLTICFIIPDVSLIVNINWHGI